MKTNVSTKDTHQEFTHEGGHAMSHQPALLELTRTVSACLLFERTFYETGDDQAARIARLCEQVSPQAIADLAVKARYDLKLRHVPLFLCRQLIRLHPARPFDNRNSRDRKAREAVGTLVSDTVAKVIRRPDEAAELLALYWKDNGGKRPKLSNALKRGLAKAFQGFSAYQLSKWDRDAKVKVRDALFLSHAKPADAPGRRLTRGERKQWDQSVGYQEDAHTTAGERLFGQLINGTLPPADTWEVGLSAAKSDAEKRVVWERLLSEKKLGSMALLMNLRNMLAVEVPTKTVADAIVEAAPKSWALPFRYISAAKAAPALADACSVGLLRSVGSFIGRMPGDTVVVIDVSGSMSSTISEKSQLSRWEAAAALAAIARECAESCRVFTFSDGLAEVPNHRGLPLVAAVEQSQPHRNTYLAAALGYLRNEMKLTPHRLIVVTDEQSHDGFADAWTERAYLINVAAYQPALDTSRGWLRVSGWSERVVDWILAEEGLGVVGDDEEAE